MSGAKNRRSAQAANAAAAAAAHLAITPAVYSSSAGGSAGASPVASSPTISAVGTQPYQQQAANVTATGQIATPGNTPSETSFVTPRVQNIATRPIDFASVPSAVAQTAAETAPLSPMPPPSLASGASMTAPAGAARNPIAAVPRSVAGAVTIPASLHSTPSPSGMHEPLLSHQAVTGTGISSSFPFVSAPPGGFTDTLVPTNPASRVAAPFSPPPAPSPDADGAPPFPVVPKEKKKGSSVHHYHKTEKKGEKGGQQRKKSSRKRKNTG